MCVWLFDNIVDITWVDTVAMTISRCTLSPSVRFLHMLPLLCTRLVHLFLHTFFFVWNIRCTNPNSNETEIFLRRSWAHVNNSTCTFTYYADRIRRVRREIEMKSHTYRFHDCVFHSRYSTVMVQLKMAILRASQLHQTNRSIYVQFVVWFIIQIRANTQYITNKQANICMHSKMTHLHNRTAFHRFVVYKIHSIPHWFVASLTESTVIVCVIVTWGRQ